MAQQEELPLRWAVWARGEVGVQRRVLGRINAVVQRVWKRRFGHAPIVNGDDGRIEPCSKEGGHEDLTRHLLEIEPTAVKVHDETFTAIMWWVVDAHVDAVAGVA